MSIASRKFDELMDVMAELRGPHGCPWDKEQTHTSLTPAFIEELYEFVEAVEDGDTDTMKEELGDLCLHIIFQAQIASEAHEFAMPDVLETIVQKLRRRHPHVFGDTVVTHAGDVIRNWEHIKKGETKGAQQQSALDGIPRHLPALSKAHKVQRKAGNVGFDWHNIEQVMHKVDEELSELRAAIRSGDKAAVRDEVGDLLFSIVNVARFADVEPEHALHQTVRKFIRRFRVIEERLAAQGKAIEHTSLDELDALWNEAKAKA